MMYMLEHCSVFMLVPPSCCYQICGQPIYELSLKNATPSSEFFRQRYPGPSHSTMSRYLQGRLPSYRPYLSKGNWKKWNSRRQPGSKAEDVLDVNYQQSSVVHKAGQNPIANKPVTSASECLESQQKPSQCTSLTTQLLKRKRKSRCEISAKRRKIMQTEDRLQKKTRNPLPTKSKNQFILDSGGTTSKGSTSSCLEDGLTLVTSVPENHEHGAQTSGVPCTLLDQKIFVGDKTITLDSGSKTHRQSSTGKDFRAHSSKSGEKSPDKTSVPGIHIEKHTLLYSRRPLKECLPKSFVLNQLKGSLSGAQRLIEIMFFTSKITKQLGSSHLLSHGKRKKRLPKRYWQMRGLFQELLQNHAKCRYLEILKKNCPILSSDSLKIGTGEQGSKRKGHQEGGHSSSRIQQVNATEDCLSSVPVGLDPFPGTSGTLSRSCEETVLSQTGTEEKPVQNSTTSSFMEFLKQHSSHWQVYTFVRECLERVVPAVLWGSNHNKCRFYKNVKKFISLGKFGTFSLQELLWKMRVNDCIWLRLTKGSGHFVPASEHNFRQDLMSKFFYWLMDSYVAELLRSFFYITETMFQKNLLFFFRKSVWSKLESIGVGNHLAKVHLRILLKEEIKILQQEKCVPLASKLRFIPKPNGLRPVVRLDGVVGAETFCRKTKDRKVQYFNTQLNNLFSVLNYERMKNPALLGSSLFGKDDIYAVWKKFVLRILELNAEMPRFYFVKADVTGAYDTIPHNKLVEVVLQALSPDKETIYSIRRYAVITRTRNGLIRRYYRRHASTYEEFEPEMKQFVTHLQESTSLRNAVVVEQSVSLKETSSSLSKFFLQFIRNSILKIKDRYYVQCCGIPQGSILSTLLCNLCYGDMENKLLQGIQKDGTLAMGIPEYGFVINPSKTVVNFSVDEDLPGCSGFKQLPPHCVFPWCGFLIDTQTLEIYSDYSSYACTSIRSSLSFNSSVRGGVSMRKKLLAVLQLKCHSLVVDLQINCLKTVCINVYKILLLQAYRFHACILQLPFNQKIKNNPDFFLKIISDTAAYFFSLLKAKNSEIYFSPTGASSPITYKAVQWLCYHAFSVKLTIHRAIYKCLLLPLTVCKISLLQQMPEATVQLLKEVTEPSLHNDFKAILD
ncbi:telomerase reverse transcriptase [Sceloporus undulatus]|uniref:telomerase reverse transcriptase n=1 Tax=Sceloporus undulatus TaxID=8520 RepID=UPI001C4C9A8B|nr:telomerase reverse transcriptase [Sceloporus undulatus]